MGMRMVSLVMLIFVVYSSAACVNVYALSCASKEYDENKLLAESPHGARLNKENHVLEVFYLNGLKKFVDEPPYEEQLAGVKWQYCGYDKELKLHLIGKNDSDLFTGILLIDETGKTLNAGHTVLFSPNKKSFLAVEQEDGIDGEFWSFCNIEGKKLWNGYAGISRKTKFKGSVEEYEAVYAQFVNPKWENTSELSADFICSDGTMYGNKKGKVTLKYNDGAWGWFPEYKCNP